MDKDTIVIVSIARTPIGNFQGSLKQFTATQLGGNAIQAALEKSSLPAEAINEIIMGCVLTAGQGQAPARQATLAAGLPISTPATTVNKMCGSGMKAIMLAHDSLVAQTSEIMIAGGMESMSNAPYLLPKARAGYRLGHQRVLDHMFYDGLEDAYDDQKLMGVFAEDCAQHFQFSRQQQDEFALSSLLRAQKAAENGLFDAEITPIKLPNNQGTITQDEGPQNAKPDKISSLKPAFRADGTVTAANSSSISDGAAALVLMKLSTAEQYGLQPLARIVAHATHAQAPNWFTTAPIGAINKLLAKTNWNINEIDLFEINEAFAVVTMAAMHELKLPSEKVNIHGGACCLGHPIGASGARIVVTLINALRQHQLKRGVAALCLGGGEATSIAIENFNH